MISTSPTLAPIVLAFGLSAAGALYFVYMWKFNPKVLEDEPGDPNVLAEVEQS